MDAATNGTSTSTCKLSMLWNWDTVDACLVTEQWHIRTPRQYAGSLIGLFFVVVLLEGVRRLSRTYDRYVVRRYQSRLSIGRVSDSFKKKQGVSPGIFAQVIRSLLYFIQFSTAYLLMLAAMSHNGGVILTIFIGAFFGFLIFARDTLPGTSQSEPSDYAVYLEQIDASKVSMSKA
ncbi:Ctr copper transporter family-domain-containing protein [Favolaschia claudopus]|uniref:Copper transport protein n=1 Tax=Favolaschia claudopus TaxID=2862362 RepID=A0AAW0DS45_9AGAR